jgi:hypothetical protein
MEKRAEAPAMSSLLVESIPIAAEWNRESVVFQALGDGIAVGNLWTLDPKAAWTCYRESEILRELWFLKTDPAATCLSKLSGPKTV